MENSIIGIGTELKINIHIEPIGDLHMSDYNFSAKFYTKESRAVSVLKKDMKKMDDDNYIALVDTRNMTAGTLRMIVEAEIPDSDFENETNDGFRTETTTPINTNIIIGK